MDVLLGAWRSLNLEPFLPVYEYLCEAIPACACPKVLRALICQASAARDDGGAPYLPSVRTVAKSNSVLHGHSMRDQLLTAGNFSAI